LPSETVTKSYRTPKGNSVTLAYRLDTADEPVIYGSIVEDEYGTAAFDLRAGDLFVDVGAYIGTVGLAVAADYPSVRVVMVEAVPENVVVISESIHINGLGDRVWVHPNAASNVPGVTTIPYGDDGGGESYHRDNRFVGGLRALHPDIFLDVQNITLRDIVNLYGDVAMLKIDCEGCEYAFLDSPVISQVSRIVGEQHNNGQKKLLALLGSTHTVTFQPESEMVGLFWATRR